ncbi:MAG: YibE/F family protein [Peptostreptococcaceae bacterium]|nr:YibE/F family protein [Peptostreptococcaceae bacterium]
MNNLKRFLILILVVINLFTFNSFADSSMESSNLKHEKAVVLSVIEGEGDVGFGETLQIVKLKVLSGKYKDQVFETKNYLDPNNTVFAMPVEKGTKVVVVIGIDEDEFLVHIEDYYRQDYINYIFILFCICVLIFGKLKGVKTLISLFATMALVFKFMIPYILNGGSPILSAILVCSVSTIITMLLISGFSHKSLCAILGTIGGVIVAGGLAFFVGSQIKLTGLSSEEANILIYLRQGLVFDFKELLFAGILLGALGAVMDVSMSVASTIEEVKRIKDDISMKELFKSGINVGRDIMGTMSNTLILAYTGSSLSLLLIFSELETSMTKIMNLDIIATEIIRSLTGSIGLIMTIPITAFLAAYFYSKKASK